MELTQKYVKSVFSYKDGVLYWKVTSNNYKMKPGDKAGCIRPDKSGDRVVLNIFGKQQFRHRVIFLWHYGWLPPVVDHFNHNMLDDRIENLRAADCSKNMKNRTSAKGSSSQYLGVYFFKRDRNWRASIRIKGKTTHLGMFSVETDAAIAYNEAAKIHHGEFANLNIIQKVA